MQHDEAARRPQIRAFRWPAKVKAADLALPAFIVLIAVVAGAIEPRFFSFSNLENLARQIVPLMIASVGQAFAIISGGLDLSIAAVLSVAGVAGVLSMPHIGVPLGVAVMAVTGLAIGSVSGFIIAYFKTTPLIVTLGMMSISQAIALIFANGVPIYSVPEGLTDTIGFGVVFGIPVTVLIGALTMVVGWVLLRKTVFGRYVYAIGSNRSAAEKSGIDVRLYTMLVYAVCGLTSGIGAIVLTAWVGAAQPVAAPTLTLQSLAAVVLGGVALTGGSGGMLQVLYGVIILGMLSNAMNMIGISDFYQTLAVGIVIILAVILDRFRRGARS
ncbi:MAG: ribose transport system permease protein [Rhodospirillaceae bacterium]|jgi:ribose transport system permease protein|nr:ribose transport system permease protein [Rhodospirillaceae bacterium]